MMLIEKLAGMRRNEFQECTLSPEIRNIGLHKYYKIILLQ